MKVLFLIAFVIPCLLFAADKAEEGKLGSQIRANKNGVAICKSRDSSDDGECYDLVSYRVDKKAQKVGKENSAKFRSTYKGATYVFTSKEHLQMFEKNPDSYLPEYGGWCAYAVAAKKQKIDVEPESFLIQDNRLLLFYDGFLSDTRHSWQNDKHQSPAEYLKNADANWPQIKNQEAQ